MKKLIHRYLNENFYVEGNCLYSRNKKISYCLGSIALIDELGKVFSMTKPQLKWFVKSWIHKQNNGFPFRNFWTPKPTGFDNIAFPLIRRVAAQTIGLDLVSVQPLPPPSGLLPFLDYQYGIDPVDNNNNNNNNNQGYVFAPYIPVETTPVAYTGSLMHELTTRYAAREVNPNYYGRINVSGGTGTTTNLEKMRKETIKKWEKTGFLDGLKKSHNKNIEKLFKNQMKQILK